MERKCLFSSLSGTRTSSRPDGQRTWNLWRLPKVPQYSTPNEIPQAGRGIVESAPRPIESRDAIPNGLRAGERAVKPHGTSTNRISSAANDARAGTPRSSPAVNRGFFQNLRPSDGPRRPPPPLRTVPSAHARARDNGMPVGGDAPCPPRSPDIAALPTVATKAAPLPNTPRYSTAPENDGERTTARTPSTDKSVDRNGPGLAAATKSNHPGDGPRECLLPKVKSRQRSRLLRSGTLLYRHLLLISPRSSLIPLFPFLHSLPAAATPARRPSRRDPLARGLTRRRRETGSLPSRD